MLGKRFHQILAAGLLFLNGQSFLFANQEEIPLERCDVLPVVRVKIEGIEFRFLVDTAATSMLNIKTFAGGGLKAIEISSWKGTGITSAREVHLPELFIGNRKLSNLKLPAIDLSPISKACGGSIDGILGVDLLKEINAKLDLGDADHLEFGQEKNPLFQDLLKRQERCVDAFNQADVQAIRDCLDSQVILFTAGKEIRGREQMIEYLTERYFDHQVKMELSLNDHHLIEDAFWFGYDLSFAFTEGSITMRGMAICRKDGDTWRLLNMHNSFQSTH
jgi:hypothetical protein